MSTTSKNILHSTIIRSIARRDLRLYFSNPTGYVFIMLFILLSAVAAFWQDRFFLNNLANLDQLNGFFPLLSMLFIPALTMGVWSEEKKQGTDELLLTLPGTNLEIVLGKFLAVVGIYTAALVLSGSYVIILASLGSPDLGLMFGNYLGYWLIGIAFISVGMLASLLSKNATISFVLGAIFCAFLVYLEIPAAILGDRVKNLLAPLGVTEHFQDFSQGVISLSGLLYFFSIIGVSLYLNVLLISKRHWPREADGHPMSSHHIIRSVALIIGIISLNVILGRANLRIDSTSEGLHSLSSETRKLLKALPDERPVMIQAFISKEVPRNYVQSRENLINFLKELDAAGGKKVEVLIHDTTPYTQEARDAREKFGITPQKRIETSSVSSSASQIFMGVAFTCGAEEKVIPFFDRGLPTEYELVRSIRMVTKTERKKIGVMVTDANLFGGFDFQAGMSTPAWEVVDELKKQYEVERISAKSPITEELDGLLVPMPSSLPQEEMDHLIAYIETGVPTLLLVDPLPISNLTLSPSERSGGNRNPFMNQGGPPPKQKGKIEDFVKRLGISWSKNQIVWDAYDPHPEFNLPPEVVFVGKGSNNPVCFNTQYEATSQLQEIVMLFPGYISAAPDAEVNFTPLLQSGKISGLQNYHSLVQRSFFGPQLMAPQNFGRFPNDVMYNLAAYITSKTPSAADTSAIDSSVAQKNLNLIMVTDLDFISEQFFSIRKAGYNNLNFDNITFFLNCMDMLIGDDSFIALRNRRVRHRTLITLESQRQRYTLQRASEEQRAESDAQIALNNARKRLEEKVAAVQKRTDLDEQTKRVMAENIQQVEQSRFEALKTNINAEKDAKITATRERLENQIQILQNGIQTAAVILPPIPVLVIGVLTLIRRRKREAEGAALARRLRS